MLSKMGQSAQKGVSDGLLIMGPSEHVHPEVTNPHKPLKLAQAYEDNYVQRPYQGITKAQAGRGRIKKLARELSQTQGKDSKTKNFILGTKHLGSQNFPECEEKVARKKKCVGVIGNSSHRLLCSTAGSHEFARMELSGAWETLVSSSVARSCATVGSQNSFLIGN